MIHTPTPSALISDLEYVSVSKSDAVDVIVSLSEGEYGLAKLYLCLDLYSARKLQKELRDFLYGEV